MPETGFPRTGTLAGNFFRATDSVLSKLCNRSALAGLDWQNVARPGNNRDFLQMHDERLFNHVLATGYARVQTQASPEHDFNSEITGICSRTRPCRSWGELAPGVRTFLFKRRHLIR